MEMTTQDTPLSPFLEQQKRVMAQKEQLERDLEQRQRYTLTPGANEAEKPYDPKAKYVVETHDSTNNTVERRVISPLPQPERIRPTQPIGKGELIEMLDSLRDDLATEQEKFDRKDEIDAAAASKRQQLSTTIASLTQQLNEARSALDQLNAQGSTRDQYIKFAAQAELRITQIATGAYNFLLEKFSQDRYEASYRDLTSTLSEEIRFKTDRSGVRTFARPDFARLHAVEKQHITNARITATIDKVVAAAEKIEGVLEK